MAKLTNAQAPLAPDGDRAERHVEASSAPVYQARGGRFGYTCIICRPVLAFAAEARSVTTPKIGIGSHVNFAI